MHELLPPREARRRWRRLPSVDRKRLWKTLRHGERAADQLEVQLIASFSGAFLRDWRWVRWFLPLSQIIGWASEPFTRSPVTVWDLGFGVAAVGVYLYGWLAWVPAFRRALNANLGPAVGQL